MTNSSTVTCDYCQKPAELVKTDRGHIWRCSPCDAWVGAYENSPTLKPLGRLANADLRAAKKQARQAFEPIIRVAGGRGQAFRWLAEQMKMNPKHCHVDQFDLEQCQKVIAICRANLPELP